MQSTHRFHTGHSRRGENLSIAERLLVVLLLLCPVPTFLGDLATRAIDVFRVGIVSVRLSLAPKSLRGSHLFCGSAILVSMCVFATVSLVGGISHSTRDLLDVLRIASFCLTFLCGASLARSVRDGETSLITFTQTLLAVGSLNAAFTACQYFFPDATRPVQEIFSPSDRHMDLLAIHGRAFGFFANPNTNALMTLILALPALALYQLTRRRFYLTVGLLVYGTVLLAGSRTGLVLAGVVGVTVCLISRRITYVIGLGILAWAGFEFLDHLVQAGYVRRMFPYLAEFLLKLHGFLYGDHFDPTSIKSYSERLKIWHATLIWFHRSPILGSGPLRDVIPNWSDNYFVYLLARYGAVGLIHYSLFCVYVGFLCTRGILSQNRPYRACACVTLAAIVVVNAANYTMDALLYVPAANIVFILAGYLTGLSDRFELRTVRRPQLRQRGPRFASTAATARGLPQGQAPSGTTHVARW